MAAKCITLFRWLKIRQNVRCLTKLANFVSSMKIEKKLPKRTLTIDADASEGKLLTTGLGWKHQIRSLTTQLDLEMPRTGITIKSGDISQSILGICFPQQTLKFCDGWVRGNDATGLYLTDDARQLKPVAYGGGRVHGAQRKTLNKLLLQS